MASSISELSEQARRGPRPDLRRSPAQLLAFGFGSGLSPRAPGTAGTVAAVPLYLLLAQLGLPGYSIALVLLTGLGVLVCHRASRELGVHDHPGIVWDEFVGYWITLWAMPVHWTWMLVGFVLFRLFDIAKPWPISYLDRRVSGGAGIMLDDIVAGVFACACLHLLQGWLS
ncbi:phosphatidylglycerophosphatase A family protein [Mangrovimicrobium sediminis]|uniref:phosphatidylglycerophosphatase A family protein n=1 Tax=Mangrovimicrobium sediminis TaxID=2562682 RepID=UPI003EBFED97